MGLNIKNERVCALAREVAVRSGQTQTGAIESALEVYLRQLLEADDKDRQRRDTERAARAKRIDDLLATIHADITDEDRAAARAMMEDLYDPETGLPR